jgi:branched-subunit amino acid aminotransferase/4-amino-4-deoxychorismate lyase
VLNRAAAAAAPSGLLETLCCIDGESPLLALHQRRLASSWPRFFSGRAPSLRRAAAAAIEATKGGRALVRVAFLAAGGAAPGDRAAGHEVKVDSRVLEPWTARVAVAVAAAPRREPAAERRHKCADRAWVKVHAVEGAFETLVWDEEHGLLEGTRTNLFVLVGRELVTPPVTFGLVPGVVRARVLRLARRLGWRVQERRISPADLRADGLLLTGSGVGVVAVCECDDRTVASRASSSLAERLRQSAFATE